MVSSIKELKKKERSSKSSVTLGESVQEMMKSWQEKAKKCTLS